MSKFINLPTIDQYAAECRKNAIRDSSSDRPVCSREEAKQKVGRNAKQTRMAMERLDAGGIEVACYGNTYIRYIDLGFFHSTRRRQPQAGRGRSSYPQGSLGCQVRMDEKGFGRRQKEVGFHHAQTGEFSDGTNPLHEESCPATAKCRIVTHRSIYRSLV